MNRHASRGPANSKDSRKGRGGAVRPLRRAPWLLLTPALALAATGCLASTDPAPWMTMGDNPSEQSDALLGTMLPDPSLPGCAAAVAREGELVWAGATGSARISTGEPLTPTTVFDVASVSKHITAMAVLVLVEDGLVRLDAPVATYLPEAGPWAETTTVSQLIHHTSGLTDYIGILSEAGVAIVDRVSQDEALAALDDLTVSPTPTPLPWEYSNSNYIVLASLVEAVSGKSFADFAKERLFDPMGSSLVVDPLAEYPDIAARYRSIATDGEELGVGWDVVGDGAVMASPTALAIWFDVIRTGLPGYPTIGEDMIAETVEVTGAKGSFYGAGVFVTPTGEVWHSGGWEGHVSYVIISADRSTTVAVECNADEANVELATIGVGLQNIWFPTVEPTVSESPV